MKRILLPLGCVLLSACVSPDSSIHSVDGARLKIRQDDNYFWPDSFNHTAPDGAEVVIDVFPLVSALVVSRADGAALTEADEEMARRAVNFYCDDTSAGLPGPDSRFADGSWAFGLCTSPSPL